MFTVGALILGVTAAFVVGLSKTGLPGGALIAVPMLATVFDGRLIVGGTLPILLVADLFAVSWYHEHARWDVIGPLTRWIGTGFVFGAMFFVLVGTASDVIANTIGVIVLSIVGLQAFRMWRSNPAEGHRPGGAAAYGTIAGFTTFVANAAGPVVNTYLARLGLLKHEMVGTSAWLYFLVNVSKIPIYLSLGWLTAGGSFFTSDALLFDLIVIPGVFVGVFSGRALFRVISQQAFAIVVLALSALAALKLVL